MSTETVSLDSLWITLLCDLCGNATLPIPDKICRSSESAHVYCYKCSYVMGDIRCPSLLNKNEYDDDGKTRRPCDNILIDAKAVGLPIFMDLIMKNVPFFPCSAFAFGCSFVGSGHDVISHIYQDCRYCEITTCQETDERGRACNKYFMNPNDLVEHLRVDHKRIFTYPVEVGVEVSFTVGEKEILSAGDDWKLGRRMLLDYTMNGDQRLCLLKFDENSTNVRMSLADLNPREDNKIKYILTVRAVGRERKPGFSLTFESQLQPLEYNSKQMENENEVFFEISKKVLQKCSRELEKGLWFIQITIGFEENVEAKNDLTQWIPVAATEVDKAENLVPAPVVGNTASGTKATENGFADELTPKSDKIDAEEGSSIRPEPEIALPREEHLICAGTSSFSERQQGQVIPLSNVRQVIPFRPLDLNLDPKKTEEKTPVE